MAPKEIFRKLINVLNSLINVLNSRLFKDIHRILVFKKIVRMLEQILNDSAVQQALQKILNVLQEILYILNGTVVIQGYRKLRKAFLKEIWRIFNELYYRLYFGIYDIMQILIYIIKDFLDNNL